MTHQNVSEFSRRQGTVVVCIFQNTSRLDFHSGTASVGTLTETQCATQNEEEQVSERVQLVTLLENIDHLKTSVTDNTTTTLPEHCFL